MFKRINEWIERTNRRSKRIAQAIAHEERAMVREERWAQINDFVKAALPNFKILDSHFGIDIYVESYEDLHTARTALRRAIPNYSDEIKHVEPEYSRLYTVAEIIEKDENIKIKYAYNGPDQFYGGAVINVKVPYSKVPESIFNDGKCGFEDETYTSKSVSFVCKNE